MNEAMQRLNTIAQGDEHKMQTLRVFEIFYDITDLCGQIYVADIGVCEQEG